MTTSPETATQTPDRTVDSSVAVAQTSQSADVDSRLDKIVADITERQHALEGLIEARYKARLDAMEMDRATFDRAMVAAKWLGGVATIVMVGFGFFAGRSISDVHQTARETAVNTIQTAIREQNALGKNLAELFKLTSDAQKRLNGLEEELSGYSALRDVAATASGFDPLVGYYSIEREIEQRREKTIALANGSEAIPVSETTWDTDFRQRAAVVFDKLLADVTESEKAGKLKLSTIDLYNAAASASGASLDFVAIELMEIAARQDRNNSADLGARLVRQRLSMSRIDQDEAKQAISPILAASTWHNLHFVLSEAFNIGLTVGPGDMAHIIEASLPQGMGDASISLLIRSRLLLLGGTTGDWEEALVLFKGALEAFQKESPTAQWHRNSRDEILRVLQVRPDLMSTHREPLASIFGSSSPVATD